MFFASSFGAYITLLYLAAHPFPNTKAFLRSAAVDMYGIIQQWIVSSPMWHKSEDGNAQYDYISPEYPYQREMRITRAFVSDLARYRPSERYPIANPPKLAMIHGSLDATAPIAEARELAVRTSAVFKEIPGGEHRLIGPGELETVQTEALQFFLERK